jgi:hypothetical protein
MPYKPMSLRTYLRYLKAVGWTLEKGGIDYNLYNENGGLVCSVKVSHGKNTTSNEVVAHSVNKTEKAFIERGFSWPPSKKKK